MYLNKHLLPIFISEFKLPESLLNLPEVVCKDSDMINFRLETKEDFVYFLEFANQNSKNFSSVVSTPYHKNPTQNHNILDNMQFLHFKKFTRGYVLRYSTMGCLISAKTDFIQ